MADYRVLKLNDTVLGLHELSDLYHRKFHDPATPQWERDVYEFIRQWIHSKDHIDVTTSGSTGKPKTISLKKKWMIHSALQTCRFFGLNEQTSALLCLPAAYIGGKMMIVRAFVSGMNLIIVKPTSNPFASLGDQVDFAALTPHQLYESIETITSKPVVKTLIIGGGAMDPELEKRVEKLQARVYATYGMTETSSHIALRAVNGINKQEEYLVVGDTKISSDERGCLVIDNPAIYNDVLITNDLVEILDNKRFRYMGRADNVINSGGVKIIPEEIEKIISPLRPERMILGAVPDKKLGEKVVLFVETLHLDTDQKHILTEKIKNKVKPYAVPRVIFYVDPFPETPGGKIDRKKLHKAIIDDKGNIKGNH